MRMPTIPVKGEEIYKFIAEGRSNKGKWLEMFEVPLGVVIKKKE
jgi:hypothetical protein